MSTCVIVHNMIIEDERDINLKFFIDNAGSRVEPRRNVDQMQPFLGSYRRLKIRVHAMILIHSITYIQYLIHLRVQIQHITYESGRYTEIDSLG